MVWLVGVPWAQASGIDRPLARQGQVLQERLYARMDATDGEGPVQPRYRRRRSGPFRVWEFEDGVVQRYVHTEGNELREARTFDAGGRLATTTRYADGAPAEVTVNMASSVTLDVASWEAQVVADSLVVAPTTAEHRPGGGLRWTLESGRLEVWSAPAADVYGDRWRDGLRAGCGCVVLDRVTAWVGAQSGVRYRLAAPDNPEQIMDVWAVARADDVWVASFVADPSGPSSALSTGRAVVALVDFELSDEAPP